MGYSEAAGSSDQPETESDFAGADYCEGGEGKVVKSHPGTFSCTHPFSLDLNMFISQSS